MTAPDHPSKPHCGTSGTAALWHRFPTGANPNSHRN